MSKATNTTISVVICKNEIAAIGLRRENTITYDRVSLSIKIMKGVYDTIV